MAENLLTHVSNKNIFSLTFLTETLNDSFKTVNFYRNNSLQCTDLQFDFITII